VELKRILAALLPAGSREHVLGDLEERGFRVRDVVNVIPRLWWSQWLRSWNGPPFAAAAASDSDLCRRVQQFAHRRFFFQAVARALCIVWGTDWIHRKFSHGHQMSDHWLNFLVCVLVGFLLYRAVEKRQAAQIKDRNAWLERHQKQLSSALLGFGIPFRASAGFRIAVRVCWVYLNVLMFDMLWWTLPASPAERWFFRVLLLLELLLVFLWVQRRERRIQLELDQVFHRSS